MDVSGWPRFQFRLRTLLLIVLLVSIPLSWLRAKLQSARMQKAAEARLPRDLEVWYDFHYDGPDDWLCPFSYECDEGRKLMLPPFNRLGKKVPGPKWLHDILGEDFFMSVAFLGTKDRNHLAEIRYFHHLKELDLYGSNVTDADLAVLSETPEVKGIILEATSISDAGLAHIRASTCLRKLSLSRTSITDAGLSDIAGLKRLQLLNLDNTQVTDAGLEQLMGLSDLQWLCLEGTFITDAGLRKLESMRALKELDVSRTCATAAGVERLRRALPECHIR